MVSDLTFVFSEETFAAVARIYASFLACLLYEFHKATETFLAQLQIGVIGSSSDREDCEQTPAFEPEAYQIFLELLEGVIIAVVDACHHVKSYRWLIGEDLHGLRGIGEAVFRASHPVVVAFESVEADCKGVYAGFEQLIDLLRSHETSVRDHAPREFEVVDASAAFEEIFAHQRLAA